MAIELRKRIKGGTKTLREEELTEEGADRIVKHLLEEIKASEEKYKPTKNRYR